MSFDDLLIIFVLVKFDQQNVIYRFVDAFFLRFIDKRLKDAQRIHKVMCKNES